MHVYVGGVSSCVRVVHPCVGSATHFLSISCVSGYSTRCTLRDLLPGDL